MRYAFVLYGMAIRLRYNSYIVCVGIAVRCSFGESGMEILYAIS